MNYDTIQKHSKSNNYFTVLAVPLTATGDEIKKQYLQLVKQYHPDTFRHRDGSLTEQQQEHFEKRFKDIAEAYSILKDDYLRSSYKGELDAIIRLREQGKYHPTSSSGGVGGTYRYDDPFDSDIDASSSQAKRGFWGKFDGFKGYATSQSSYNETSTRRAAWYKSTQRTFHSFYQLTKLFVVPFVATGALLFTILYNNQQRAEQRRLMVEAELLDGKKRHRTEGSTDSTTIIRHGDIKDDNTNTNVAVDKVEAWFNDRYNRWETPAPWDKNYQRYMLVDRLKKIDRNIVYDRTQPKS